MFLRIFDRFVRLWERVFEGRLWSRIFQVMFGVLAIATLLQRRISRAYLIDHPSSRIRVISLLASISDRQAAYLAVIFSFFCLLAATRSFVLIAPVWRRLSHTGPISKEELLYLPEEPNFSNPYSFHFVHNEDQLRPYVSESEYFLGVLNPELTSLERFALYKRWHSVNPRAFLYLCKAGSRIPVALSIMLPLTKCGHDRLLGVNGEDQKKVILFGRDEILERGPCHSLLVDTFIVSSRRERSVGGNSAGPTHFLEGLLRKMIPRGPQKRYGRTLLLRHVALFWNDETNTRRPGRTPMPRPFTILAETDKTRLVNDICRIGFKLRGHSAIDASLFEFVYPPAAPNPEQRDLVEGLVQNIWKIKGWKIF